MKLRETFRVQKRAIQINNGTNKCKYFRQIFKDYRILTVTYIYIYIYILNVLGYIKRFKGNLKQNLIFHVHNTRNKLNFHVQFCNRVLF